MRFLPLSITALASLALAAEVKVDITRAVECERKSQKGDKISVHYRGNLDDNGKLGKEFDASYNRGQPLSFVVGKGSVIKGWDDNLIDMCIGEKRTLTIPPEFGYGQRAMGPIPAGSTLIFETELMGIDGVESPEEIVVVKGDPATEKTAEEAEAPIVEDVKVAEDKAAEGVKAAVTSKIAEAAEALKVVVADTDGDGQEHNEL